MLNLILIIFGPVSVVSIGLAWVFGKHFLTLDPEKGLLRQGALWMGILLPLAYFMVLGGIIWSEYELDISSAGLVTFFKISGIPLAVLSLTLPLTVLISRLHATEQTAKQIEMASHKNNLDSFYAHRNELFTYFDHLNETEYLDGALTGRFGIHPRLHKAFFNGRPELGVPEVDTEHFNNIENILAVTRMQIDKVLKSENADEEAISWYLCNACVSIHTLSMALGLPEIYIELADKGVLVELYVKGQEEKQRFLSVGTSTDDLVAAFRYANDYFNNLCDFAGYTRGDVAEEYQYIDTGGSFRELRSPGIIEQLQKSPTMSRGLAKWREQQ